MKVLDPAEVKGKPTFNMPRISLRPSVAINQALDDLYLVEQLEGYEVYMSTWHGPLPAYMTKQGRSVDKCGVCLGGAMLARVNGFQPDLDIEPGDMENGDERLMVFAMDNVRESVPEMVTNGLRQMGVPDTEARNIVHAIPRKDDGQLTCYDEDPMAFKRERRILASELRKRGY